MTFEYQSLSKEVLQARLEELLKIDHATLSGLAEEWESQHFLFDLHGKWDCSWIALDRDILAGFVITSIKPAGLHVHRVVVSPDYQRRGIGIGLLRCAAQSALRQSLQNLTLRVAIRNSQAVEFYQRLGFVQEGITSEYLDLSIPLDKLLSKQC